MNSETEKVIMAITDDLLALAHLVMESDSVGLNSRGVNTLADSRLKENIAAAVSIGGDEVVIQLLFDNYIDFLERGRAPKSGKQPPIDALRDWALRRNIPTDNDTLFAISYAIWRDGYEGRPILATLMEEIGNTLEEDIYNNLFEAIITELTKYFN